MIFLTDEDFAVGNAIYNKEAEHYCTSKEPTTERFSKPSTADRFPLLDLALASHKWKK